MSRCECVGVVDPGAVTSDVISVSVTNRSILVNVLLLVQDELTCQSISYSSLRSYLLYYIIGYSSVSVLVCM